MHLGCVVGCHGLPLLDLYVLMLDPTAFGQRFKSYVLSVWIRLFKNTFIQPPVLYDVMRLSGIALATPEERRQGPKYAACVRIQQTPLPGPRKRRFIKPGKI